MLSQILLIFGDKINSQDENLWARILKQTDERQ